MAKKKAVSQYLGGAYHSTKAHALKKGACAVCKRSGADLKAGGCPGYTTAADLIDWTRPLPVVAVQQNAKRKRGRGARA